MITITLEGDALADITIVLKATSAPRTEAKPDKGIVAPDEREGRDGPKKFVCTYCKEVLGPVSTVSQFGRVFCSPACAEMFRRDPLHYGLGPEEIAEILERVR